MVKFDGKPSFSASRRRIRTQAEWKVQAQISFALSPSIRSSRSFSSPAALLVKVMARMRQGATGSKAAMRCASSPPRRRIASFSWSASAGS